MYTCVFYCCYIAQLMYTTNYNPSDLVLYDLNHVTIHLLSVGIQQMTEIMTKYN